MTLMAWHHRQIILQLYTARYYLGTVLRSTPWTSISDFSAVGLRKAALDPKIDEEHDARISFGHRPLPACARGGQSRKICPFPPPARQAARVHAQWILHADLLRLSFIIT